MIAIDWPIGGVLSAAQMYMIAVFGPAASEVCRNCGFEWYGGVAWCPAIAASAAN